MTSEPYPVACPPACGEDVASVVKAHRKARGMSIDELAARSGVAATCIGNVEAGRSKNPQIATRKKLADALGIPPEHLMPSGRVPTDEWLREQYEREGWSIRAIAEDIGRSYGTTRAMLLGLGVELRQNGGRTI